MVKPRVMKASEFKAKCLHIMDEVAKSGEAVIITKNGTPISRLVPFQERPKSIFGALKETIEIHGDIIRPIDVTWEAEGAAARHARARLDHDGRPRTRTKRKSGRRKRIR